MQYIGWHSSAFGLCSFTLSLAFPRPRPLPPPPPAPSPLALVLILVTLHFCLSFPSIVLYVLTRVSPMYLCPWVNTFISPLRTFARHYSPSCRLPCPCSVWACVRTHANSYATCVCPWGVNRTQEVNRCIPARSGEPPPPCPSPAALTTLDCMVTANSLPFRLLSVLEQRYFLRRYSATTQKGGLRIKRMASSFVSLAAIWIPSRLSRLVFVSNEIPRHRRRQVSYKRLCKYTGVCRCAFILIVKRRH